MAKTTTTLGLMLAALLLILACVTSVTPPPAGFVDTAIAETQSVAASQTAQVQAALESVTPTASRAPSATPPPTFTLVVLGGMEVRALVDAPCRAGPGFNYEVVYTLREGRLADLVGRSADGLYLTIRIPTRPEQLCWLENGTVTVGGAAILMPIFTAPPTSTPSRTPTPTPRPTRTSTRTPTNTPTRTSTSTTTSTVTNTPTSTATATSTPIVEFNVQSGGVDNCTATTSWWINFEVENIGAVDFQSLSLTLTDTTTSTVLSLDSDDFTERTGDSTGCSVNIADALPIGNIHLVSEPVLNYDPTGHVFNVSVTLCTEPAQAGFCDTQTIDNFTP